MNGMERVGRSLGHTPLTPLTPPLTPPLILLTARDTGQIHTDWKRSGQSVGQRSGQSVGQRSGQSVGQRRASRGLELRPAKTRTLKRISHQAIIRYRRTEKQIIESKKVLMRFKLMRHAPT